MYHWLGLKCSICESYNTTQLELLGPEQTPQQIREQYERAQALGEAGLTASQSVTPSNELTSPVLGVPPLVHYSIPNDRARSPTSPQLLPHSPTRSARSVTPVIGSYFGTSHRFEPDRRNSYFSIFSAGQPTTPQGSRPRHDSDEEMEFWGGSSPRSHEIDIDTAAHESAASSSSDESMVEEEDDDVEEDGMELFGHR